MVQITRAEELKDLQQRATCAQEHQQKHHAQLDEFQEIDGQLVVKVVAMLQEVKEHRQIVNSKANEEHPVKQDLTNCQSTSNKVQL